MSHRMFVAAVPPANVTEDLGDFLTPRRGADSRLRWTDPAQWHLTTAFFASIGEHQIEPLIENLVPAVAAVPAFRIGLCGAGHFGPPEAARVLWLGADPGSVPLGRLSERTRNAGNRSGVAPDGSTFTAHLTLGRSRGLSAGRWLQILDTYRSPEWLVEELWLIESILQPRTRPRHERLVRLPLDTTGPTD